MADSTALIPFAAPPVPALIDSSGRPLRTAATILTTEIAAPTVAGLRNIISSHPAQGLDPARLTQILRSAEQGQATAYLELAEEMEEKYPHYQSVLGTRKRAVSQLPVTVEAASEDADDEADAQFLRDWLNRLTLQAELFDIMDGLGKGYSATEIVWSTGPKAWLPATLKWRFPQFFEYDRITGEQLLLRGGVEGNSGLPQPLPPYKFIVHEPKAKSGLPIRGGLARTVAWYYLFVNFTIKDWMTFLEVYGLPLRVGKYQNGTSEEDIRKLAQAVAQIGSDAGCVIPQSMMIDFVTSNGGTANPEMFEKLCKYADDQVSKAVLGQTSSADAKSGGLGSGQANLHSDVRDDIRDADAAQLSATLTAQLGVPMIQFNRGMRERYPIIKVGKPDEVDVEAAIKSIAAGVSMSVPIGVSYFRQATGIPEPKPGEELLSAPAPAQAPQEGPGGAGGPDAAKKPPTGLLGGSYGRNGGSRKEVAAALSDAPREPDAIDRLVEAALSDSAAMSGALLDHFDELVAAANSLEEIQELVAIRAGDVIAHMDTAAFVEQLERAGFAAKIAGMIERPGQ